MHDNAKQSLFMYQELFIIFLVKTDDKFVIKNNAISKGKLSDRLPELLNDILINFVRG